MSGSNHEPPEDAEYLGHTVKDIGAVGNGHSDVGAFLPCHSENCPVLRVRDWGCDSAHRADYEGVTP